VPGTFLDFHVKDILRLLFISELLYHSYRTVGMNDASVFYYIIYTAGDLFKKPDKHRGENKWRTST
jgi:hypothetical protein